MAKTIGGAEKRIGLALSGGGFRAAALHLGVMTKLHELGLLSKVDLLSCVSGGSIAGATIGLHWPDVAKGLAELETYLTTRSEAVASVIGGILNPFETRLDVLARGYASHLFGATTLGDLRKGPRLYLNATNLATGNLFSFVTGTGGWGDVAMGDWELGHSDATSFPLSMAVAASSSFPPVFPPLKLDAATYPPGAAVEYVTLTDGGVYDNMGMSPMLRPKNRLDYVIVSDGGSPLEWVGSPTESGVVVLYSALRIMMEQVRGLEFDRLDRMRQAGGALKPLWFSINSREGEVVVGDGLLAGRIETNLRRLDVVEMTLLKRHGAALVASRIEKYASELLR